MMDNLYEDGAKVVPRKTVLYGIAGVVGLGAAAAGCVLIWRKLFGTKSSGEVKQIDIFCY